MTSKHSPHPRALGRAANRRGASRRRGLSVLETALVMPLLMLLTFGVIEYGYFFYVYHSVQDAARQGARVGCVEGASNSDITNAVKLALDNASLGKRKYTLSITDGKGRTIDAGKAASGDAVAVKLEFNWSDLSLVKLSSFMQEVKMSPFPTKVQATTVMRREG